MTPPPADTMLNRACDAFATAVIFQGRARRYRRLVRLLAFFGLAIPGVIGAIVLADLFKPDLLKIFIYAAGGLGVVQFSFSIWSTVADWPGSLDYSSAANADNSRLSNQLKTLVAQAAAPPADFEVRCAELITLDDAQIALDVKRDISDRELVYGHRAALVQFKRKCGLCDKVPPSRKMPLLPWSRCDRCGGPKKP